MEFTTEQVAKIIADTKNGKIKWKKLGGQIFCTEWSNGFTLEKYKHFTKDGYWYYLTGGPDGLDSDSDKLEELFNYLCTFCS